MENLIIIFIFLTHLQVSLGEETCHRTNCKKEIGDLSIQYYSFTKIIDKKFSKWTPTKTISVTGTQKERESTCTKQCMKDGKDLCRSVNLSPYNAENVSTCETFNNDVYKEWTDRVSALRETSTGWTSFHLYNSFCESLPCNVGLCMPDYVTDGGYCVCHRSSGKFCETFKSAGYWNFDDGSGANTGFSKEVTGDAILGSGGILISVPERSGKVVQCTGLECLTFDITQTPCLINYEEPYCATGFTLSFWVRILTTTVLDSQTHFGLIKQGENSNAGIDIYILHRLLNVRLNFLTESVSYGFSASDCPIDAFSSRWQFIALTYDPKTNKAYVRCNNIQATMAPQTATFTAPSKFWIGGWEHYLLDEVFYVSSFYDEDSLTKIQEMTKAN